MATQREKNADAGVAQKQRADSPSGTDKTRRQGTEPVLYRSRWGALRPHLTGWPHFFRAGSPMTPWEAMQRVNEEIEQLFESLGLARVSASPAGDINGGTSRSATASAAMTGAAGPITWLPQIETLQRPGQFVVRADLPGLKPQDVNVSVEDGVLTLWGERQREEREERDGFVRTERIYGGFHRALPLPDSADENGIKATFRDGVLEVTVPVSAEERARRINIQS